MTHKKKPEKSLAHFFSSTIFSGVFSGNHLAKTTLCRKYDLLKATISHDCCHGTRQPPLLRICGIDLSANAIILRAWQVQTQIRALRIAIDWSLFRFCLSSYNRILKIPATKVLIIFQSDPRQFEIRPLNITIPSPSRCSAPRRSIALQVGIKKENGSCRFLSLYLCSFTN